MARKHNCPKRGHRARSRYPQRLARRGIKSAPQMASIDELRGIHAIRVRGHGNPWPTYAELRDPASA